MLQEMGVVMGEYFVLAQVYAVIDVTSLLCSKPFYL